MCNKSFAKGIQDRRGQILEYGKPIEDTTNIKIRTKIKKIRIANFGGN